MYMFQTIWMRENQKISHAPISFFFLKVIKHIWSTIIQVWKKNSSKKSLKVQIYYDVYACDECKLTTTVHVVFSQEFPGSKLV